jgi:two-component system, NarL family, invasion response regulator UvrY
MNTKIKIAIADDHTILRKGVIELIRSFDEFELVLEAINGEDLLHKLEDCQRVPDICLLDINMPKKNGYDTAKEMKEKWPAIKILAFSMHDSEYAVHRMLKMGVNGYLLKNATDEELRDALNSIHTKAFYAPKFVSEMLVRQLNERDRSQKDISQREFQFLSYCGSDLTYKEIGDKMKLNVRTVEKFRDSLFEKLKIKTRASLVVFATNIGLSFGQHEDSQPC